MKIYGERINGFIFTDYLDVAIVVRIVSLNAETKPLVLTVFSFCWSKRNYFLGVKESKAHA
jgi:hypothetical protein